MTQGDAASIGDLRVDQATVNVALVRRLLTGQFPQWADLPLAPVESGGTDHVVFRLGADMAVRLPRAICAIGMVEKEQRWLPRLAPLLPLPIPAVLGRGLPTDEYPWHWSVYRWLAGVNASTEYIADPRRTAVELATFLTALRQIDATDGPIPDHSNSYRGVPIGDPRDSVASAARILPAIAALRGLVDTDAVAALWDAALQAPAWDGPPTLIHGDLHNNNLLTINGRLSAVIDFGCLAVGDPACDLMVAWTYLPAESRTVFRETLQIDDATWARGRIWGLSMSMPSPADFADPNSTTAEWGHRHLDDLITDHANDS